MLWAVNRLIDAVRDFWAALNSQTLGTLPHPANRVPTPAELSYRP
jgi:hypothetical protein